MTRSVPGLGYDPTRRVHARPGLRLVAYASESATRCGYAIIFIFYRFAFTPSHLDIPGLSQGLKGYICWKLLSIRIVKSDI